MPEFQKFPFKSFAGMARLAVLIKLFQMDICMAVAACHCQGFINHGFAIPAGIVAFFTGNVFMFPGEGVACRVMIHRGPIKSFHHVAGGAVFIKLTGVWVFLMAIAAIGKRRFPVFFSRRMAFNASHGDVFAPQRVAGAVMVKRRGFP